MSDRPRMFRSSKSVLHVSSTDASLKESRFYCAYKGLCTLGTGREGILPHVYTNHTYVSVMGKTSALIATSFFFFEKSNTMPCINTAKSFVCKLLDQFIFLALVCDQSRLKTLQPKRLS